MRNILQVGKALVFQNDSAFDVFIQEATCEISSYAEHNYSFEGVVTGFPNWRKVIRPVNPKLEIREVIFNPPATIVYWQDGSKTVVKCQDGDEYSKEIGLAMCIAKKALGNSGNFNEVFKRWIPVDEITVDEITVDEMRERLEYFCEKRKCSECPLHYPVCRCGCGTFFDISDYHEGGNMTNDEIRDAYKIVFGNKKG